MTASGVVEFNGGIIRVESAGAGPAVVLIHGFGLDRRMWSAQVAALYPSHKVVTYDCRGFGSSSHPTRPYSHAADLHAVLDWMNVSTAHLVGSSMGGRIALDYALRWPDSVESIVVMGSDVGGYRFEIDWDVEIGPGGIEPAKAVWLRHPIFQTVRRYPAAWDAVHQMVDDYSGWHWRFEDVRDPPGTDTVDRLHEIQARATVVVGALDLPDFHAIAGLLGERMPKAHVVTVAGAGHLVNLESPAACADILRRHLRV